MGAALEMTTANRVVLVDETGRVYERTGVEVQLSRQDDGLTLKVFVKPLPTEQAADAKAEHSRQFGASLEGWREKAEQFAQQFTAKRRAES